MWPARATLVPLAFSYLVAHAAPAGAPTPATIYRCEIGGIITFSDRPCDTGAQLYEPDTSRVSTYSAPAASSGNERPTARIEPPRRRSPSIAEAQAKQAEECARLRSDLKEIRSKMRAGYRVKEGERLRERQSRLQARLRARRCS
jgi:hypothetical protein